MSIPTLHIFTISHYCEKARWALDYLGVEYQLNILSPISHRANSKRLGLKKTSVPVLEVGSEVIQGSDKILEWAEQHKTGQTSLMDCKEQARDLEQRFDDKLGVHIRRWYYSESLVEYPDSVRKVFTQQLPVWEKIMLKFAWSKVAKLMIKFMDLGPEQGAESLEIVKQELNWLDNQLSAGNSFLCGESFSSADLTAASLLGSLVIPKQHPNSKLLTLPPKVQAQMDAWQDRPTIKWVSSTYAAAR